LYAKKMKGKGKKKRKGTVRKTKRTRKLAMEEASYIGLKHVRREERGRTFLPTGKKKKVRGGTASQGISYMMEGSEKSRSVSEGTKLQCEKGPDRLLRKARRT